MALRLASVVVPARHVARGLPAPHERRAVRCMPSPLHVARARGPGACTTIDIHRAHAAGRARPRLGHQDVAVAVHRRARRDPEHRPCRRMLRGPLPPARVVLRAEDPCNAMRADMQWMAVPRMMATIAETVRSTMAESRGPHRMHGHLDLHSASEFSEHSPLLSPAGSRDSFVTYPLAIKKPPLGMCRAALHGRPADDSFTCNTHCSVAPDRIGSDRRPGLCRGI
jgi:hypothetical protein